MAGWGGPQQEWMMVPPPVQFDEEVAAALQLGCDVVINDDLDAAVAELQRLIATTRSNKARRLGYH